MTAKKTVTNKKVVKPKNDGWIKQEHTGKFHDFAKEPTFIGIYTGQKKEGQGKWKNGITYDFIKEGTEQHVSINGTYFINEDIEKNGIGTYKFILTGVERLKGKKKGQTLKQFDIFFKK